MREPETPVSIFYPLICRAGNAPTEREMGWNDEAARQSGQRNEFLNLVSVGDARFTDRANCGY